MAENNKDLEQDPFSEFGGKAISNKKEEVNPFAEFGGSLVEKKKNIPSQSSVTKLPLQSQPINPLQQGANIVGGGVISDISAKSPKKENEYFKQIAVGIRPSAQGDIVERIYENPMGVDVLQIAPPKREQKPKEVTAKAETKDKSLRGVKPIPAAKYEYEDVGQGDFLNTVSALDRGFYKNLVGNPVKGLGTLLEQGTAKITGGSGKAFISDALISFGDYFNNAIDELAPQDENFKNSLLDQFGQAFGQVASLVATGGVGGLGKTAAASTALKSAVPKAASVSSAAKTLGSQLLSPTSVSAGLSMGQSEFDRAKQAGATDEQAFEVFYKNAAVGSILEKIPVMQFLKRFNQATKGGVANYIKTKGVAGITGGLEEMTTETLQQLYSNKTAKDVYNLNESIFNGLAESGGVGFGVGFLLNAMGAKAKILRKQGKVADATILELQIDDFKEKAKTQEPATKKAAPSDISDVNLQEQVEVLPTRERFIQEGDKFYEVVADGRQMTKTEITEDDYNQGKLVEEGQKVKAKEEVEKPTEEQILKDVNDGNIVTFDYNSESEVPDIFRDKITSKGEMNGIPFVKVTMAKSEADYILSQQKEKQDAIQKQAAGQVPIQSETTVSEEVEGGKPKTELEEVAPVEVNEEEVVLQRQEAEPPTVEGGRKVATISGLTEEERVDRVEKRKKSTALTKEEVLNNDLVDLTNQLKTARGLEKANTQAKIRQKVLGLNAEAAFEKYRFDGVAVRKRTESKTKGVRYTKINRTSRDSSGGAIKEDAVLLTDRSPEFTNIFEALVESPALEALQVDRGDGTSMTKEQIQSALEDALDGIPSVAADNLLNALEEGFNRGFFDLRAKDLGMEGTQTVQAMLDEFIGAEKEVVGEPMDEEALLKFLEKESKIELEEDIELLDNIENLITEYESEPTKTITKGEVSSTKTESETRVTEQPKPTESRKSEGKPKTEVSRQPDEKAEPKGKDVDSIEKSLKEKISKDDAFSLSVLTLPKEKGKINYKDIKVNFSKLDRFLNNPDALEGTSGNKLGIYNFLKSGGKLPYDRILLSKDDNQLLDGNNRVRAMLALGITDFDYSYSNEKFMTGNSYKTIAEEYVKVKADGSNPELVKAVEELLSEPKKEAKQTKAEGEPKPKAVEKKEEAPKKISDKAREQAAKLRSGEANVLPDWLRANLPKGTKKQGADINDVYAKALEVFADTYDKLNDFKKAADEAFKGISDWFKENNIDIDEADFKAKFEAQLKGEQEKKSIKDKELGEGREVALAHADTEQKRAELGLEGRTLREVKKDEQLEAEADEAIKNGYNIKGLMKRILGGDLPTDTEHIILVKYAAGLESKLEKLDPLSKEFADVFNEINQVYKASEKGGSELGAAFRARQKRAFKEDSLGEMLVREAEVNMVEELTPAQREEVVKEYEEIKKAKEEWEKKYNELIEQQNQKDAEEEVAKVKKSTTPKKKDFNKERQSIKDSIKAKWAKAANDGTLMAIPVPYAKQLAAIAPDVSKLMRSYVEEGVTELSEIVKNIHTDIKDYVEGITEKDVRDIIGGVYNEKRTRNELVATLRDLKEEQKLLLRLEALERGEKPTTEKAKREQNKKLKELRDKIKSYKQDDIDAAKEAKKAEKESTKKSPEEIALDNVKKRVIKQIQELEEKINKGDFSKEAKKEPIKLDAEALELKDKLIKLKQEREIRILQLEYANRTSIQKAKDLALEVINVPRTVMASMDFSAPLRQGIVATVAYPKQAAKAFLEMFRQAVSQKRFDRWFYDLRESSVYPVMEKAGLYIADPHDPKLSAKEEMFMNNLAEKIPLVGKMIKGSERAYVSYLNKMRADLFVKGMMAFEADGKNIENSPELYKDLASFINNSTGRGKMTKVLEDSAPILNSMFFSPRLMASRINMLNPAYYQGLSPEIQKMALKDMLTFLGFGLSILALAGLAGADVEEDPRSPNFGKIKIGDTTYDIWGGFQQYIVELTQLVRGETKSATTGQIRKLDGKTFPFKSRGDDLEGFIRGKVAPVPAAVMNLMYGKKVTGQRTDLGTEAGGLLSPLMVKDAVEAYKKDGILGSFAVGVPAAFGIGVQTISSLPENADEKNPVWRFIKDKKQRVPEPDTEMMKVGEEDRMMTDEEAEDFLDLRIKKIERSLKGLIEKGKYVVENEKEIFKKASQFTPEQLEKEISKISRNATKEAKEEMFGEKTKSERQKRAESKAERKNKRIESKTN